MVPPCQPAKQTVEFCGLSFWNASVDALLEDMRRNGGYVVVPAAPALADMREDSDYMCAIVSADYAVIDSGYVAIFMAVLLRRRVQRISGLRLLQHLFIYQANDWAQSAKILWVSPSADETRRISHYLRGARFDLDKQIFYEAPYYSTEADFRDDALSELVENYRPDIIILGIAGGKQEKLAHVLRTRFDVTVPMFCTGAAMAFLSGGQASIPTWADRCFLGWFFRILQDPRTFLPRYLRATWRCRP